MALGGSEAITAQRWWRWRREGRGFFLIRNIPDWPKIGSPRIYQFRLSTVLWPGAFTVVSRYSG
jgi:hypothetical protein